MTKITEAGALYLKDYYVLNEAKDEMDQFLNTVLATVHTKLAEELKELSDGTFQWVVKNNQSSPGYLQVNLLLPNGIHGFIRAGNVDVYIIYRDIRNTSRISEPKSIELTVTTSAQAKQLRAELMKMSEDVSEGALLGHHYPALDLSSSENSAETIVDKMLSLCVELRGMIEDID